MKGSSFSYSHPTDLVVKVRESKESKYSGSFKKEKKKILDYLIIFNADGGNTEIAWNELLCKKCAGTYILTEKNLTINSKPVKVYEVVNLPVKASANYPIGYEIVAGFNVKNTNFTLAAVTTNFYESSESERRDFVATFKTILNSIKIEE